MSQSWMGSDFSNEDLAKSDSIVDDYTHSLEGTEIHEGKTVYVIKCTPKPGAAVVWGAQRLKIREDRILLLEEFYDRGWGAGQSPCGFGDPTDGGQAVPKSLDDAERDRRNGIHRRDVQGHPFRCGHSQLLLQRIFPEERLEVARCSTSGWPGVTYGATPGDLF